MNSEVEDLMTRLANECARTLLDYYKAETASYNFDVIKEARTSAWLDHTDALDRFERMFPGIDWREVAGRANPALMQAIERSRP